MTKRVFKTVIPALILSILFAGCTPIEIVKKLLETKTTTTSVNASYLGKWYCYNMFDDDLYLIGSIVLGSGENNAMTVDVEALRTGFDMSHFTSCEFEAEDIAYGGRYTHKGNEIEFRLHFTQDDDYTECIVLTPVYADSHNPYGEDVILYRDGGLEDEDRDDPDDEEWAKSSAYKAFCERYDDIEEDTDDFLYTPNDNAKEKLATVKYLYERWDVLLNDIYQHIKSTSTESDFSYIRDEERQWVSDKEYSMKSAGSVGSYEYYIVGMTTTRDRCSYLLSFVK